jgi:hypothetical protein
LYLFAGSFIQILGIQRTSATRASILVLTHSLTHSPTYSLTHQLFSGPINNNYGAVTRRHPHQKE